MVQWWEQGGNAADWIKIHVILTHCTVHFPIHCVVHLKSIVKSLYLETFTICDMLIQL
jgi:hypothetical protein